MHLGLVFFFFFLTFRKLQLFLNRKKWSLFLTLHKPTVQVNSLFQKIAVFPKIVLLKLRGWNSWWGTTEAVVCKDNEQTYTLQGCAPLECAPMPKCNQTGYTLSLGHRSIRVLYVWLGGIQHVVFFSDGSFKKAHEMRCLACNKLVKLNKNYHFVVKMDAFNEPLYFLPMSFFFVWYFSDPPFSGQSVPTKNKSISSIWRVGSKVGRFLANLGVRCGSRMCRWILWWCS